jgi:phosphoglycolate phosphatase-like HAD superfamily hydrolase
MFKNILFDLDGTLTDSSEGITKSMQLALRAIGIDEPDLNELKKFIGPPLRGSMVKFYNSTPDEVQTALEVYRKRYTEVGWAENKAYPGMVELCRDLQAAGFRTGMCTAKPEFFAVPIAEKFGFQPYLETITGATLDTLPCGIAFTRIIYALLTLPITAYSAIIEAARLYGIKLVLAFLPTMLFLAFYITALVSVSKKKSEE